MDGARRRGMQPASGILLADSQSLTDLQLKPSFPLRWFASRSGSISAPGPVVAPGTVPPVILATSHASITTC